MCTLHTDLLCIVLYYTTKLCIQNTGLQIYKKKTETHTIQKNRIIPQYFCNNDFFFLFQKLNLTI